MNPEQIDSLTMLLLAALPVLLLWWAWLRLLRLGQPRARALNSSPWTPLHPSQPRSQDGADGPGPAMGAGQSRSDARKTA